MMPPMPTSRVDERDTMFARMARTPGTPPYKDYYSSHKEFRKADDRLRSLPPLLHQGGRYYDPEISKEAERFFRDIGEIEVDGIVVEEWKKKIDRSSDPTRTVKDMCLALGAVAAGCTALETNAIYTHKGRLDEDYGREIRLDHPCVIVFLVEMDYDAMQRAPRGEAIRESARQYYRAAAISKAVAATLGAKGHAAKAHYDAHYDLILPPLAVHSGLGELGRNNILISDRFGSRVRIGAVSTDFPLEYAATVDLGADHFCSICKKCAKNCPSRALSMEGKEVILGVEKYPTDTHRCYAYWRAVGTDCGICMAVCPFSHRNNSFHNFVRWMVRLSPRVHRLALLFDNWTYGRRWNPAYSSEREFEQS